MAGDLSFDCRRLRGWNCNFVDQTDSQRRETSERQTIKSKRLISKEESGVFVIHFNIDYYRFQRP
jgi:hypothetical protein